MPLITTAKEARDLVYDKLAANKTALGLGYIGKDDERKLPRYPAVVVTAGPREKELHGTQTFAIVFRVFVWVYHAKLSIGHRQRSDEDLDLVSAVETLLEHDLSFNDSLIHGWVESDTPGVFQPRASKGDLVIGTRMVWMGLSEQRFQ